METSKKQTKKTFKERREAIWNKIAEVERMTEEREKFFDNDYNCIDVDGFLAHARKRSFAQAAAGRMIVRLMVDHYDGWTFERKDYLFLVRLFKRFLN